MFKNSALAAIVRRGAQLRFARLEVLPGAIAGHRSMDLVETTDQNQGLALGEEPS